MRLGGWSYLYGARLDDCDFEAVSCPDEFAALALKRLPGTPNDELLADLLKHYSALDFWSKLQDTMMAEYVQYQGQELNLFRGWKSFPDFGRKVGTVPAKRPTEVGERPINNAMKHTLMTLKVLDSVLDAFRSDHDLRGYRGTGHPASVFIGWDDPNVGTNLNKRSSLRELAQNQANSITQFYDILSGYVTNTADMPQYKASAALETCENSSVDQVSSGLLKTFQQHGTKTKQHGLVTNIARFSAFLRFWLKRSPEQRMTKYVQGLGKEAAFLLTSDSDAAEKNETALTTHVYLSAMYGIVPTLLHNGLRHGVGVDYFLRDMFIDPDNGRDASVHWQTSAHRAVWRTMCNIALGGSEVLVAELQALSGTLKNCLDSHPVCLTGISTETRFNGMPTHLQIGLTVMDFDEDNSPPSAPNSIDLEHSAGLSDEASSAPSRRQTNSPIVEDIDIKSETAMDVRLPVLDSGKTTYKRATKNADSRTQNPRVPSLPDKRPRSLKRKSAKRARYARPSVTARVHGLPSDRVLRKNFESIRDLFIQKMSLENQFEAFREWYLDELLEGGGEETMDDELEEED